MPISEQRQPSGVALAEVIRQAGHLTAVRRSELTVGDVMVLRTRNSLYVLRADAHGQYHATGGWFDRKGLSPYRIAINGCTWGGAIIKVDVLAACGLCVEFSNRVVTSPVHAIAVLRAATFN
jgi:hypothetical protein